MVAPFSLTLIGTVHRSGGYAPLRQLLAELRPDCLTLEMSEFAVAFRRGEDARRRQRRLTNLIIQLAAERGTDCRLLARHPEIIGIRRLLALPFEYRAAADHAREKKIPLEPIDSSTISARKLRLVEAELLTLENLRLLTELPATPASESGAAARAFVLGSRDASLRLAFLAPRRGEEEIGERDRLLANEIRRRFLPGRHLVHIGGWVHLVDDPQGESLYSRLADLAPRRLLLEG